MPNRRINMWNLMFVLLIFLLNQPAFAADDKIIKEEVISFDKCLEVINTSENKLSIAPEINDLSAKKRIAVFTLVDGTLTITCDGEAGKIKVSTNTD